MTRFSKLGINERGELFEAAVREIKHADIGRCPHVIFNPDHYRADGSCRCNDESHTEMADWGYVWRDGQWRGEEQ